MADRRCGAGTRRRFAKRAESRLHPHGKTRPAVRAGARSARRVFTTLDLALASRHRNPSPSEARMAKWLMKSEPETFSWDDLVRDGGTQWDGVRNYAARLHLN